MDKNNNITFEKVFWNERKTAKSRKKKRHITIVGVFWDHAKNIELRDDYTATFNAIMDRRRRKLPVKGLIHGARQIKNKHQELGHPITETREAKRRRAKAFTKIS